MFKKKEVTAVTKDVKDYEELYKIEKAKFKGTVAGMGTCIGVQVTKRVLKEVVTDNKTVYAMGRNITSDVAYKSKDVITIPVQFSILSGRIGGYVCYFCLVVSAFALMRGKKSESAERAKYAMLGYIFLRTIMPILNGLDWIVDTFNDIDFRE